MAPDLFIGLVTHPRSRFPDAVTDQGLLGSLARELTSAGVSVATGISDQDEHRPELLTIDRAEVTASVDGELASELRWRQYLSGRPADLRVRAFMTVRQIKRRMAYAPPWHRTLAGDDPGPRMVRRLVNIELSHLRIIDDAVTSGASWALLIEDDAWSPDATRLATELTAFLSAADDRGQPAMMNLSESFSPDELQIRHLLTPLVRAEGSSPWRVFSAQQPVTNTVCAVLYRRDLLVRLHDALREIPLSPVLPIDFKINEAVMRIAGGMQPGDCWVASPAPIQQRSGVPAVSLRP